MPILFESVPPVPGLRYLSAHPVGAAAPARDAAGFAGADRPPGVPSVAGFDLRRLARPGMRAVIAFTDATRRSPDRVLVGHLLRELGEAGVAASDITLLCATGLHRRITPEELRDKLGPSIASTAHIAHHDSFDADALADLGVVDGIPVVVNRRCAEADLLLATGVVEPHQYAGYSGGAKTVVIGCAGEATIAATHGPGMLDRPGVRLGEIGDNPFQAFIRAAGERARVCCVANALHDAAGEIVEMACGAPDAVHDALVERGRGIYECEVEQPVHAVLAGVDTAKGRDLYQASRAVTYLALATRTPLEPGAPIILDAPIPEGVGLGTGEGRFGEILMAATSPAELVTELRRSGFPAGAQRAYILAQALADHPVIVVAPGHEELIRRCHMTPARDVREALVLAEAMARRCFGGREALNCLVVPNALATLPRRRG